MCFVGKNKSLEGIKGQSSPLLGFMVKPSDEKTPFRLNFRNLVCKLTCTLSCWQVRSHKTVQTELSGEKKLSNELRISFTSKLNITSNLRSITKTT